MADEADEVDWAGPKPLRLATALSFLPAFPLCLAHGIISGAPVPAVGLVPLAGSAALGVALPRGFAHDLPPVAIFVTDVALATSLMVVLVFTWIDSPKWGGAGLAMLASYATVPLLGSFLIHLTLALRAVHIGLALDDLTRWLAWQAVPPDCPNCQTRLRPSLPTFPWLSQVRWGYARLFENDEEAGERYRDDHEDEEEVNGAQAGVGAGSGEPPAAVEPAAEDVVPKGKGKGARSSPEATPWDT